MKCLQKVNVFGFLMKDFCEGEFHVPNEDLDTEVLRKCRERPDICAHHHPVYDNFEAFVYEARHAAKS